MSEYRIGDVVIFGRKQGEKTLGTVKKVNQKTIKVSQEESRGTMKAHEIGTVWKVPIEGGLVRHATEAEAARLKDTEKHAPSIMASQIPERKSSARKPSEIEDENCARRRAAQNAPRKVLNPRVISDGSKLRGAAMPGILKQAQRLVGRTIAQIGYVKENSEYDGVQYFPTIVLDDGTELVAQQDDECNGPGSLAFGDNILCEIF
jgi:hypothetical protein